MAPNDQYLINFPGLCHNTTSNCENYLSGIALVDCPDGDYISVESGPGCVPCGASCRTNQAGDDWIAEWYRANYFRYGYCANPSYPYMTFNLNHCRKIEKGKIDPQQKQ